MVGKFVDRSTSDVVAFIDFRVQILNLSAVHPICAISSFQISLAVIFVGRRIVVERKKFMPPIFAKLYSLSEIGI